MDAIKFIKERNRMCKNFGGSCDGCPANKNTCCDAFEWQEELVAIVKEWATAHPQKTHQARHTAGSAGTGTEAAMDAGNRDGRGHQSGAK